MFQPIGNFFSRFKKIAIPNELLRKAICQAIKEVCHINIGLEELSVNHNIVYIIPTHPTIKSEIFLHKKDILSTVNKILNKNLPLDIR